MQQPSLMSYLIRMEFSGTPLSNGTAFVVETCAGHLLITARHNFTGKNSENGHSLSNHGGAPNSVTVFTKSETISLLVRSDEWEELWIEHPVFGSKLDVVALPISKEFSKNFVSYKTNYIYQNIDVAVSESVSVIGFPFARDAGGLVPIWMNGFIASEPDVDYGGRPCFLVDCRTRPGQSGSPVVAFRTGNVGASSGIKVGEIGFEPKGVYVGRLNEDSDIGIVIRWSAVLDLVKLYEKSRTLNLAVPQANLNYTILGSIS